MKAVQIAQNKMLRMVEGVSLKEHFTTKSLLQKHNLPSVNQLAGKIKLLEAWKSIHINDYLFKMESYNQNLIQTDIIMRPNTTNYGRIQLKQRLAMIVSV